MVKRLIDYEIEKNNDLATDIKGAVERQYQEKGMSHITPAVGKKCRTCRTTIRRSPPLSDTNAPHTARGEGGRPPDALNQTKFANASALPVLSGASNGSIAPSSALR